MVEDAFAGVEVAAVSHRGRVEVKDVEDCGVVRSLADRERSRLYLVCSAVHSLAATELAVTVEEEGGRESESERAGAYLFLKCYFLREREGRALSCSKTSV